MYEIIYFSFALFCATLSANLNENHSHPGQPSKSKWESFSFHRADFRSLSQLWLIIAFTCSIV